MVLPLSYRLKFSMVASLAVMIGITTLAASLLLESAGVSFLYSLFFIAPFFLLQWIFAPKLIEAMLGVKEAGETDYPELHRSIAEISKATCIKKPMVMVADTKMPNAFAYGNPFYGFKVAVTKGLLEKLNFEEVEAVLGHELGHLKHRDVQIMMVLSLLPAIFYYMGRMLVWSSLWGGGRRREGSLPILLGFGSMILYFILNICLMHFSRMREHYADKHAVDHVEDGGRKLMVGLVKIHQAMRQMKKNSQDRDVESEAKPIVARKMSNGRVMVYVGSGSYREAKSRSGLEGFTPLMSLKPLMISDPDTAGSISLNGYTSSNIVEKYLERELTFKDRLLEFFSTHPNIVKRLKTIRSFIED